MFAVLRYVNVFSYVDFIPVFSRYLNISVFGSLISGSDLVLAKQGKIPNTLLTAAGELFSKGGAGMDSDNENMLADVYGICEVIAKATLMQPTYEDITNAGMELSDDQIMAIFNYTQNGVKALESFRKE